MMQDFVKVIDRRTPHYVLPTVIEHWTDRTLDYLREVWLIDSDLSADDRAWLAVESRPLIRDKVAMAVESAWLRLQTDASAVH